MYGNTAVIGEAIAASLREQGLEVEERLVSKVDPKATADVDLLVVGGPTHAHGMTSSATRKVAVEDEKNDFAEPTVTPGLRGWVKRLPSGTGRLAAAFDTRFDKSVVITGSAAKGIGRRLEGRGFRLVVEPECFLISTQNRLVDGETAHATAWGARVAERAGGVSA
jgi:flavodoxin